MKTHSVEKGRKGKPIEHKAESRLVVVRGGGVEGNGRRATTMDAAFPLEVLKTVLNHVMEARLCECAKTH